MKAVVTTATLVTEDGVPVDTVHLPGPQDLAIVMAHGFTQSWQRPMVWRIARRFNLRAGVVTFDFRGHGRSGGLSTLGDKEINDLDVAVHYARLEVEPARDPPHHRALPRLSEPVRHDDGEVLRPWQVHGVDGDPVFRDQRGSRDDRFHSAPFR